MDIGEVLTQIGSGLVSIVPSFFKSVWLAFCNLFLTFTESEGAMTITGFNALGSLMLAFFIFYICYKITPTVCSFLKARVAQFKSWRASKKAK